MSRPCVFNRPAALLGCLLILAVLSGCAGLRGDRALQVGRLETDAARIRAEMEQPGLDREGDALAASLAALERILDYAAGIRSDPSRFDAERIGECNRTMESIRENIARFKDPRFQCRIIFPEGAHRTADLAPDQLAALERVAAAVVESMARIGERDGAAPLRITLRTTGHTDEYPIASGTTLEREIRINAPPEALQAPDNSIQQRRLYNRVLSRMRARNVNHHLMGIIRAGVAGRAANGPLPADFVQKIAGLGEAPPSGAATPPYRALDPRRRVCEVRAFVETLP